MKHPFTRPFRRRRADGFTLVEMLAVLVIIAILIGLTLAAASGVMKSAARSRAKAEIAAMGGALESYKNDNGQYPVPPLANFTSPSTYTQNLPSTSGGPYQLSSEFLYEQLSGNTEANATYGQVTTTTPAGHIYMTFKASQLGNYSATGGSIYIQDPFGNSYGYYAAAPNAAVGTYPNNGQGMFDLWSTAGDTSTPPKPVTWVTNWNN